MKTVRRLFYTDITLAVAFVAVAFLALSFFIDFLDQLTDVGQGSYTSLEAGLASLLLLPGHFYEVAPIAVLIGTIYTLARMAQSSEYTILRTGGLGPGRALGLLASLGLMFGVLTFVVGDYVTPVTENEARELQAVHKGGVVIGGPGAWLKDHVRTPEGERNYSINVGSVGSRGRLHDVRIFEFDAEGRLLRRIAAATSEVQPGQAWALKGVTLTRWIEGALPGEAASGKTVTNGGGNGGAASHADNNGLVQAPEQQLDALDWQGNLSAGVVASAVSPVNTMSTIDLARYIGHLKDNEQASQRQRIQFWKRALYPFACLVMIGLALPFAYLNARSGGISLKVFGGIMLGISFVLLNNVASHLGLLHDWTPWMVAAAPSALYLLLSMAAFSWLVRYR